MMSVSTQTHTNTHKQIMNSFCFIFVLRESDREQEFDTMSMYWIRFRLQRTN